MNRREALSLIFGAPLAARLLAGCQSCDLGGAGAAPEAPGELMGPQHRTGHLLRSGQARALLREAPREGAERLDVAIVGGGPAGLAAAWELSSAGSAAGLPRVALFELEEALGGTSRSGESELTRYPLGAHYLPVPRAENADLVRLLEEMGALEGRDEEGQPIGNEELLIRAPHERLFCRGFWHSGLFPRAVCGPEDLAQRDRFEEIVDSYVARRDGQGRRAFTLPSSGCSEDPELLALDRISAADWLRDLGLTSEPLRWWLEYGTRDDYGLTLEDASAWSLLFYHAARKSEPGDEGAEYLTWPEGNGALVRQLAHNARAEMRTGWMVAQVIPEEAGGGGGAAGGAWLGLIHLGDHAPRWVHARRVILALPQFLSRRLLAEDPRRPSSEILADLKYGAWMVANLHLRRRPLGRGAPPSWDNVLYDSPSLGYVTATHQRGRDTGPTVFTYYLPFTDSEPAEGRRRLLALTYPQWREAILRDLGRGHPDIAHALEKIEIWRWGHAMAQPRVGVRESRGRRLAQAPLGPIHFAHSDLSGMALFEESFSHGLRAAREVLRASRGG